MHSFSSLTIANSDLWHVHQALHLHHQVRGTQSAGQHSRAQGGQVEGSELRVLQLSKHHGGDGEQGHALLILDGLRRDRGTQGIRARERE